MTQGVAGIKTTVAAKKNRELLTGNKGESWGQWSAGFLLATLLVVTSSQRIVL